MKSLKMKLGAACAWFTALLWVGCSEISPYEINSPDDLQDRIDAIENAKPKPVGDQVIIDIEKKIVGADDNSSAWWTEFSQYFTVESGRLLHVEFINYTSGAGNWNNWNLALANKERDTDGYAEYFVLRADLYGWGNADYQGAMIQSNYAETFEKEDFWDDFRAFMQGAHVTMIVDHSKTGYAFITVTAAKDGKSITMTYNQPVSSTEPVVAFLVCDGSHFDMQSAYTDKSQVQEVADVNAASISVTGTPSSIELGSEDVWGNAVATVTFEDGSTAIADRQDIEVFPDDLSTPGIKYVVYTYNKTKQGKAGKSVAGYYTVEVTNAIVSISATAKAYYIGNGTTITVSPFSVTVEATYGNGAKGAVASDLYTVTTTKDVYEAVPGTVKDVFTVAMTRSDGTELTTKADLVIAASPLPAQEGVVGNTDMTTGWWTAFSRDWKVAAGESQTVSFVLKSDNAQNYHCPDVILRKADNTEYAVVREDHYGWKGNQNTGSDLAALGWVLASDWNWDTFKTSLNNSQISVTVANDGSGKASIRYDVIDGNGVSHHQYYDNISVDSSDVQFALTTEGAYLQF